MNHIKHGKKYGFKICFRHYRSDILPSWDKISIIDCRIIIRKWLLEFTDLSQTRATNLDELHMEARLLCSISVLQSTAHIFEDSEGSSDKLASVYYIVDNWVTLGHNGIAMQ